jgi:hypothetical protein
MERRRFITLLATVIPFVGTKSADSDTVASENGVKFSADWALAFLDDNSGDLYREVDGEPELTIDTRGERTEITLVADFDEPGRLEKADIYSVQIVPKLCADSHDNTSGQAGQLERRQEVSDADQ